MNEWTRSNTSLAVPEWRGLTQAAEGLTGTRRSERKNSVCSHPIVGAEYWSSPAIYAPGSQSSPAAVLVVKPVDSDWTVLSVFLGVQLGSQPADVRTSLHNHRGEFMSIRL